MSTQLITLDIRRKPHRPFENPDTWLEVYESKRSFDKILWEPLDRIPYPVARFELPALRQALLTPAALQTGVSGISYTFCNMI